MRWKDRRQSQNVEDRRGISTGAIAGGGLGTLLIVALVWMLGGDPQSVIDVMDNQVAVNPSTMTAEDNERAQFVSVVLGDTEEVWDLLFKQSGYQYRKPRLVLYNGAVQSACGYSGAATGPFYCPADERVYIDLSFYDEMTHKLRASGDFAFAYVIAHEVGHHVQNLLGTMDQVMAMQNRVSQKDFNQIMVRLELQADFYAGVWAHHAQKMFDSLEEGDIEEAMGAASAVGDDRLMKQSQGYVIPDAFTHGTSEQRSRWFMKGYRTGDPDQGDTFSAKVL
ncbi:MAG TPA: neutral zinc metallopeptidase [bacterium]|jgi:predicted metalloprotease|nr:neutral zinc metallopeptidase [bacterium]HNT65524.1 neutral zinc metallopeptidase [bacterium]HOX87418.1 neutral zinc metallopeptidase [bacterium]HPG46879.1 neutral zinc metallopeptidase [bacterium]HPM99141.1 neutral zinc metallopeptidase [bacterium]